MARSKQFSAAVRLPKGSWQHRSYGSSAREAKRTLAKKAGIPFRLVDGLPLGKTRLTTTGEWGQVVVEAVK